MYLLHSMVLTTVERFPERPAIACHDGTNSQSKTYSQLWRSVQEISSSLSSLQVTNKTVAVILRQNINLPAILLGLLLNNCCYFPLRIDDGRKYVAKSIKSAGATWIFHDSSIKEDLSSTVAQLKGKYNDSDVMDRLQVSMVKLELDSNDNVCAKTQNASCSVDSPNMAYCITTSGTTGHPKVIRVPHSCIMPNILDFSAIFQVCEKDTVLLTAPLTFDPSIIDIFLALTNGARLLIIPDTTKKNPSQLIDILHSKENVSVLQATPSLIRSCPSQLLRQTIFGPLSSLRVLALGGEGFPSQAELKKWVDPLNQTRFFNLYGITEVSCWASCEHVDVHILIDTNDVVSIGRPLSKTLVCVDTSIEEETVKQHERQGYIWIGSSERVCVVDGPDLQQPVNVRDGMDDENVVWRNTGDIGKALEDGRIVFVGREDDQIKRHGKRMTLSALETVCCELPWVSKCCALIDEQNHLVIFYTIENVESKSNPMNQIHIDAIPGTANNMTDATEFSQGKKSITSQMKEERFILNTTKYDRQDLSGSTSIIGDGVMPAFHDLDGVNHRSRDVHQKATTSQWKESDSDDTQAGEEYSLRVHISDSLPSHYIPDRFVRMETFPLTTHGKLDKKRLLQMEKDIVTNIALVRESPVTWFRQLWMTHLPKAKNGISMTDNFLSLGGDSLAAVNLINKMETAFGDGAPQHFMDTLLNNTFGACVERLQDSLKLEDGSKKRFVVSDVKNDGQGDKIEVEESDIEYNDEKPNDRLKKCEAKKIGKNEVDNHGCNAVNSSSQNKTRTFEIDSGHHMTETNRHLSCSSHEVGGKVTIPGSSCVVGRGNRVMAVHIKGFLQNQNECDCQQQECKQQCRQQQQEHHQQQQQNLPTDHPTNNTHSKKKGRQKYVNSQLSQRRSDLLVKDFGELESSCELCQLRLKWTVDTKKCVDASPVIAVFSLEKRLVFIGSHSGHLSAVDLDVGTTLWTIVLPDRIESSACITRSMAHVVVGCYDGVIYVVDVNTGEVEWEFATGSCVKCSPCVDEGTGHVICGSHDGWLYSLHVEEKLCVWKHFLGGGSVYSSPVSDPRSHLVVAASLRGKLVALDCTNGSPMWCVDLKKPLFSSPCLHDSHILIGCVDCCLYCIDKQGRKEWSFKTDGPVFSSPILYKDRIFFGSHDRHFYCLALSGELIWKVIASSQIFSTPFVFQFQHKVISVSVSNNDKFQSQSYTTLDTETETAEPKSKMARIEKNTREDIFHSISQPNDLTHFRSDFFEDAGIPQAQTLNSDLVVVNKELTLHENETITNYSFDSEDNIMKNDSNVYGDRDEIYKEKPLAVFASTEGTLHIVEAENGKMVTSTRLNGEVFSSPVFHDGKIVVGCRDNLLYCFDLYS